MLIHLHTLLKPFLPYLLRVRGGICSFHFRLAYQLLLFSFYFIFSYFKYRVKYELYKSYFCRDMYRKIQICIDISYKNVLLILFTSFVCLFGSFLFRFQELQGLSSEFKQHKSSSSCMSLKFFLFDIWKKNTVEMLCERLYNILNYLRPSIILQTLGNSIKIY